METQELKSEINVSAYKLSLAKHQEENAKRLLEHYQKLQDQKKINERQKQNQKHDILSFVCDWQ